MTVGLGSVRLRAMRRGDLEVVAALEQELFAGDPPWTAGQFASELAGVPDTRWYVVAEDDAGIIGYAGLAGPSLVGEPADVMTIAVAPNAQRRGVGTTLMAALYEQAAARGAAWLMLEVREDNAAALAFYRRHGFTQVAVRRNYYRGGRAGLVLRRRVRPRTGIITG